MNVRDALPKARGFVSDNLSGFAAKAGHDALDLVEAHADQLGDKGKEHAQAIFARYTVGDRNTTRLLYLSRVATFEERRAASAAMTAQVREDSDEAEVRWRDFEAGLKEVGRLAWRIGLMALSAVI